MSSVSLLSPSLSKEMASSYISRKPQDIWKKQVSTVAQSRLFWEMAFRSLEAFSSGEYTKFDAHTTSNCCHGISILVHDLISKTKKLALKSYKTTIEKKIKNSNQLDIENFPHELIHLTSLYLLNFIGDIDHQKGRRTYPRKLKEIVASVSIKFSDRLVKQLQTCFSNIVATQYQKYLSQLDCSKSISGALINIWGKYIQKDWLRTDHKDILYASCMFSMQIVLAYLIQKKAKVILVNDLITDNKALKYRYIQILMGNGNDNFLPLTQKDLSLLEPLDFYEPVIVFGGYVISDMTPKQLSEKMAPWSKRFSELCLACDIHYPQFPKVSNDLNFDHTPIKPEDPALLEAIKQQTKVDGVSSQDPSLFMLSHIYPASLGEAIEPLSLPYSSLYTPSKTHLSQDSENT